MAQVKCPDCGKLVPTTGHPLLMCERRKPGRAAKDALAGLPRLTARDLRGGLGKYLKRLPVAVVMDGEVVAVIVTPQEARGSLR